MMKGFAAIALLIASQVTEVMGSCSENSNCSCVNSLCQDANGVIYPRTTCTASEQCNCRNTGEGSFCFFSPPDPTFSPTRAPSPPSPPSTSPTKAPSSEPTNQPSGSPTKAPSPKPTLSATETPSGAPAKSPTDQPTTANPTKPPTDQPSKGPTAQPTNMPSQAPTDQPTTANPTKSPTEEPSKGPTAQPSNMPSQAPTDQPTTSNPTKSPTDQPMKAPTAQPTKVPSQSPTNQPTIANPTKSPTDQPTKVPTAQPTNSPSQAPTDQPTTANPSKSPTDQPTTANPTKSPTNQPSKGPTAQPTNNPSQSPTDQPTTANPTKSPTDEPTKEPRNNPTEAPSQTPSNSPTDEPTKEPTNKPTEGPSPTPICAIFPTCDLPERGCGWGIWNVWTCQCDCAPGFCLSANQECYDGCTTHLDFNPFGGCAPGCDCPWYPDPSGKTHCVSTVNIAGQYNIHRTAGQCCQRHFSYLNINSCVDDSEQSIENARETITENRERPKYYYPDLYGRDNCIYHNGYYDWMMGSYSELYLFSSHLDCCSMWYPAREDCPDLSDPTERDVIEKPYAVKGYFYPHESDMNCRFGRNYPQWMAQKLYIQDYLYTTPEECCTTWYPAAGESCPLGPDDGVQGGTYWQTDVAFYPNWKGNWCNVGNDYPEWMADPMNIDTHLFDSGAECCEHWYPDQVLECEKNVIATHNGKRTDGKEESGEWHPTLAYPYDCTNDGDIPSWMLQQGYKQYYVFSGRSECCKAHYCSSMSSLFWRRNA